MGGGETEAQSTQELAARVCDVSESFHYPDFSWITNLSYQGWISMGHFTPDPSEFPSSLRCEGKEISPREAEASPRTIPAHLQAWSLQRMDVTLSLLCLSFLCKMRPIKPSSTGMMVKLTEER